MAPTAAGQGGWCSGQAKGCVCVRAVRQRLCQEDPPPRRRRRRVPDHGHDRAARRLLLYTQSTHAQLLAHSSPKATLTDAVRGRHVVALVAGKALPHKAHKQGADHAVSIDLGLPGKHGGVCDAAGDRGGDDAAEQHRAGKLKHGSNLVAGGGGDAWRFLMMWWGAGSRRQAQHEATRRQARRTGSMNGCRGAVAQVVFKLHSCWMKKRGPSPAALWPGRAFTRCCCGKQSKSSSLRSPARPGAA